MGNIGPFRALRTLRALRPLRAVSRWEGMRVRSSFISPIVLVSDNKYTRASCLIKLNRSCFTFLYSSFIFMFYAAYINKAFCLFRLSMSAMSLLAELAEAERLFIKGSDCARSLLSCPKDS